MAALLAMPVQIPAARVLEILFAVPAIRMAIAVLPETTVMAALPGTMAMVTAMAAEMSRRLQPHLPDRAMATVMEMAG
jgi:hypothetical protein